MAWADLWAVLTVCWAVFAVRWVVLIVFLEERSAVLMVWRAVRSVALPQALVQGRQEFVWERGRATAMKRAEAWRKPLPVF